MEMNSTLVLGKRVQMISVTTKPFTGWDGSECPVKGSAKKRGILVPSRTNEDSP